MSDYVKKSGRVEPNRPGYTGYWCNHTIEPIFIPCPDCVDNNYKKIPNSIPSTVATISWTDYSGGVPVSWTHECSDTYRGVPPGYKGGGFLDVEYPDVPPVSTRGITLKSGSQTFSACYDPYWMDPIDIDPHTSHGYSNASNRQRRWYYRWWPPGIGVNPKYSDDNPSPRANIYSSWTMGVEKVDFVYYNLIGAKNNRDKITINYCNECPKEDYKGPFQVYLNRDITSASVLKVEAGRIIRSGTTNLDIPVNYINTYGFVEEVYLYYEVTESTGTFVLNKSLVSAGYPTLAGATSDHYYIVLAQTVADATGDLGCMQDFLKIVQIQHGEYIKAGSGGTRDSIPAYINYGGAGGYNVTLYENGIDSPSTGTGQLLVMEMYINDALPSSFVIATRSAMRITGGG